MLGKNTMLYGPFSQRKVQHLKLVIETTDNSKWKNPGNRKHWLILQGTGKRLAVSVQRLTSNDRHNKQILLKK